MALTALVSLVLLVLLMRSILRPLSRLMRQSRKVQKGDLNLEPVKPSGPTDLRVVTRAFNDLVSTLQSYESQLDRLARRHVTHGAANRGQLTLRDLNGGGVRVIEIEPRPDEPALARSFDDLESQLQVITDT